MKFRISEIGPSGLFTKAGLDEEWFAQNLGEVLAEGQAGQGTASLQIVVSGDKVTLTGTIHAEFYVDCSRCLEPASVEVDAPLLLVLEPESGRPEFEENEEVELTEEDLNYATYHGDEVDLDPFLREQILLGIPIAPLCREDCWPEWFSGLVETEASVEEAEKNRIDPRWQALLELKKKQSSQ
jgi:uncharacterized protein